MAVPIVAFSAWSGTGKTTYLEQLIPHLKARSIRIGLLKHDVHGFTPDAPQKDTARLARAGADAVAIASPAAFCYIEQQPANPMEAVKCFRNVDLILAEGYKRGPFPKIALYRQAAGKPLAVSPSECLAIVSDAPLYAACPVFPLDDPASMADFLVQWISQAKGGQCNVHLS